MDEQRQKDALQLFLEEFTLEIIKTNKNELRMHEHHEHRVAHNEKKPEEKNEIILPRAEILKLAIQQPAPKPIVQPRAIQPMMPRSQSAPASIPMQKVRQVVAPQPIQKPTIDIKPEALPPEQKAETEKFISEVKPALLPSGEIDFGKMTQFIRDPLVTSIECKRPDNNLFIKRGGNITETDVKLTQEEANSIIKAFSERARIPLVDGVLRARLNELEIFAIISKFSASRFILTKTIIAPMNRPFITPGMPQTRPPMSMMPPKRK